MKQKKKNHLIRPFFNLRIKPFTHTISTFMKYQHKKLIITMEKKPYNKVKQRLTKKTILLQLHDKNE